ncbi:hypothetical protein [Zobellia roscoffensis]|uniref:hypothetical protein n=1 Tax=Zobellia roscoffensis TaxID=2779508 RepID=UPI00188AA7C3|nr:hypothetical protein [Zobellia roscoffensis]
MSKSHYWEKEYEKRLMILKDDLCKLKISESLTGIYYGLSHNHCYDATIEQFIDKKQTKIFKVFYERNQLKRMEKRAIKKYF